MEAVQQHISDDSHVTLLSNNFSALLGLWYWVVISVLHRKLLAVLVT
jgi:hypothetical protein